MSERAEQVHAAADRQIAELIEALSSADDEALHRPCPGREKLGDGTVGAIAEHTAGNYQRIGRFVAAGEVMSSRHQDKSATGSADRREIVARLAAAREDFTRIAELTDQQLDRVPPKDSFRFCDGERTLEQVLLGLLKHQDHQVQSLRAALAPT